MRASTRRGSGRICRCASRIEMLEMRRLFAISLVDINVTNDASGNGTIGGIGAHPVDVSKDGRYVAFVSDSTDLVPGLTVPVGMKNVYLRDLVNGTTVLVSRTASGEAGGGVDPHISGDGRFVVFESESVTLPGDTDTSQDIFLYTIATAGVELISVATGSGVVNSRATVSNDGRYVAYSRHTQVVRYDRDTATTEFVAIKYLGGGESAGFSTGAQISDNGRYITFESTGTDLTPDDTSDDGDLFIRDMDADTTVLATPGANGTLQSVDLHFYATSGNGRFVAFRNSFATGSIVADNLYVFDRDTSDLKLVSKKLDGTPAGGIGSQSIEKLISRDADTIAFVSTNNQLVSDDPNGFVADVFLYDISDETITRVANQPDSPLNASISNDANIIAYESFGKAALTSGTDANNTGDIFVHNRGANTTYLTTTNRSGTGSANAASFVPIVSTLGSVVVFQSNATDLVGVDASPGALYGADPNEGLFVTGPDTGGGGGGDTTKPVAIGIGFVADPVAGGSSVVLGVNFTDEAGLDPSSYTGAPLSVTYPDSTVVEMTFVGVGTVTATGLVAQYTFAAPGGTFDEADNGTYSVNVLGDLVADTSGNRNEAAATPFTLAIEPSGPSALTADITSRLDFLTRLLAARTTSVTIPITNPTPVSINVAVDVTVVASLDTTFDATDPLLGTLTARRVSIPGGRTRSVTVDADLSRDVAEGDYYLAANIVVKDRATGLPLRTFSISTPTTIHIGAARTGFVDDDGTTVRLRGASSVFDPVTGGMDLVADATDPSTRISMTTRGGDRSVAFDDISVPGSARSISLGRADVLGDISVGGTVRSITARDVKDNHVITIGGADQPVTLKFRNVAELSINSASRITSLTATDWVDQDGTPDVITAPSIGTLSVRNNFNANLVLSGAGVEQGKSTLGTASIRGAIGADTWDITGRIRSLSAGSILTGWTANVSGIFSSISVRNDAAGTINTAELTRRRVRGVDSLVVNLI